MWHVRPLFSRYTDLFSLARVRKIYFLRGFGGGVRIQIAPKQRERGTHLFGRADGRETIRHHVCTYMGERGESGDLGGGGKSFRRISPPQFTCTVACSPVSVPDLNIAAEEARKQGKPVPGEKKVYRRIGVKESREFANFSKCEKWSPAAAVGTRK